VDIKINAKVQCRDKQAGLVSGVIFDPIKDELTHIVAKYHGEEYEVAASHIVFADDDIVEITLTSDALAEQPNFLETSYIRAPMEHTDFVDMTGYYYSPYVTMETVVVHHKHIPVNEVAYTRNTPVFATDGRIGKIDELVVDPTNYHISHIVLREGHLWGQKDIVIGADHIKKVDHEGVHLNMMKKEIEALPTTPIKRHFAFTVGN
jgi:sporulation protein YlmC with PRC-barrel domain